MHVKKKKVYTRTQSLSSDIYANYIIDLPDLPTLEYTSIGYHSETPKKLFLPNETGYESHVNLE